MKQTLKLDNQAKKQTLKLSKFVKIHAETFFV